MIRLWAALMVLTVTFVLELLFAEDLENEYRLPASTWRYWHYNGRLTATKLGRRLVWKRADVLKFLAEQGLGDE
jgi:hypothetical protein